MNIAHVELQLSLFDNYLKLNSLFPIRSDIEAYNHREDVDGGIDHYEVLETAFETLKLCPSAECPPGRWKAALMPVLNPLLLFNSLGYLQERNPVEYKRMQELLHCQREIDSPFTELAKEIGGFADFAANVGRPLSAYVNAYKSANHSHFGRFVKYLKKRGWGSRAEDEMLLYLSHPVFRYDLRQRFLEGKHVPLLEVDILHQWAKKNNLALPEQVASYASIDEGERTHEGAINDTRPDGSRLTRQQILDQCKALLPDVLAFINEVDVDATAGTRDYPAVFGGFLALFAVASLYDDPAILTLAEAKTPHLTLAYRRLAGYSRVMSMGGPFESTRRFALEYLNEGFIPSLSVVTDALIEKAGALTDNYAHLGGTTFRTAPTKHALIHTINQAAMPLTRPDSFLLGKREVNSLTGELSTAIGPDIGHQVETLVDAYQSWESDRYLGIYEHQRFQVLADSKMNLPEEPITDDTPITAGQYLFSRALPSIGEYGQQEICTVKLLGLIVEQFVSAPSNQESVEQTILPTLNAMVERLAYAHTCYEYDNSVTPIDSDAKSVLVPTELAERITQPLKELRGDLLEEIAHEARRVGMQIRHAYIGATYLGYELYQEAERKQAAVTKAAANVQPSTSSRGNAYQEIETQMAALDKARESYRLWADKAVEKLMPYIASLQGFLDVAISGIPLETTDQRCADQAPHAATDEVDTLALIKERDALAQAVEALKTDSALVADECERQREELDQKARAIEAYAVETTQLTAQVQALSHHLGEVDRQKGANQHTLSDDASAVRTVLTDDLIRFSESPTPSAALTLASSLYPEHLVILDSAFESASQASDTVGTNVLRRLLLLATKGIRLMQKGSPLYALNDILPGEVACSESDSSLNIPKLRQERTFKEKHANGEVKVWVMTAHNWINYDHRLYFEYDAERGVFVIGHAGRHLQIVSG